MTPEEMRDVGRRIYLEVIEKGNVDYADEIIAHDALDISPNLPPGLDRKGPAPLKAWVSMLHAGFSDIAVRIHELLPSGDTGVGRFTIEATHTGEYLGIPATGKTVSWDLVDIVQFREGKVQQHYGLGDNLGLLQQLGVIPSPEQMGSS